MQTPVERPLRVRDHAVLAALVAAAYGVYEGNQLGSPRATIVAAALLILGGAALGALQGSAHALLRRLWARARRDWTPADPPERSHADTLRRIATLTAASLCGLAFLVVLWQLVLRLGAVQDPALVAALLIFVIAVGAAATAVATASAKSSGSKAPRPTQATAVSCDFSSSFSASMKACSSASPAPVSRAR